MSRPARFALSSAADALGKWTARWVPSAFTIAVLLTAVTFVLALTVAGAGPLEAGKAWLSGFFESALLAFAMQMALVMFTGYLLALTNPVRRLLEAVASQAASPKRAVVLVALTSMLLAYVNWGLSLVASALLVRTVARKQPNVDYRLLVACAYFGLGATWHAGLSASAPLTVATPNHFLEAQLGIIGLERTLFSPFNLALVSGSVVLLSTLAWLLHPPPEQTVRADPALLVEPPPKVEPPADGPAAALDGSRVFNLLFGALGLLVLAFHLGDAGWRAINLNVVNFFFLFLAVLLHRSPRALLAAAEEAASTLSGVVLQFPLYAGIYGLFKATALTDRLGEAFVGVSSAKTFPMLVYLYSGLVNYFVPSGGAKWAIEAPYLLKAAQTLGVAPEKVVLAYAWGDMATDLLQPFWAIPLLSIARLEFKDVLGFLLLAAMVYVPLVTLAFFLLG